jgi:hypothetical protein
MFTSKYRFLSSLPTRAVVVLACLAAPASLLALVECSSPSDTSDGGPPGGSSSSGSGSGSGGSSSSGVCAAYVSTGTLPAAVSFKTDVVPVLQKTCGNGGTSCHSGLANATVMDTATGSSLTFANDDGGVLPPQGAMSGLAFIHTSLVGAKAYEEPNLNLVAAGDPKNSYLMHKMDGDQCLFANVCDQQPGQGAFYDPGWHCGRSMPTSDAGMIPDPPANGPASALVDPAIRDKFRAWITQGAMNN